MTDKLNGKVAAALIQDLHDRGLDRDRFRQLDREAMLTRLPRGYPDGHPAERWLRYKSFTATRMLTEREVTSPRLPAMLERDFAALLPLVRWLNQAIGYQPWARRY